MFRTLVAEGRTESARTRSRLLIGPWSHRPQGQRRYGNGVIDYGPEAEMDIVGFGHSLVRLLAGRQDILVYQTKPLDHRIEFTGNPIVELFAASSAPDTDWIVRLIDLAPDGLARDVSIGFVRARYRYGLDKPQLLHPGEVVKYSIRMNPTYNAFLPGHRIRLDVTSSDFPNYDRNHNTAVIQNADPTLAVAKQIVHDGGTQATRILLPQDD